MTERAAGENRTRSIGFLLLRPTVPYSAIKLQSPFSDLAENNSEVYSLRKTLKFSEYKLIRELNLLMMNTTSALCAFVLGDSC